LQLRLRQFNVAGLRNVNHAKLIGRIDGQPPFPVGERMTYSCPTAGNLFLGINDRGVTNNSGTFIATVRLRKVNIQVPR